jgi:hypothetical protein
VDESAGFPQVVSLRRSDAAVDQASTLRLPM